jgi:hypothetical protein
MKIRITNGIEKTESVKCYEHSVFLRCDSRQTCKHSAKNIGNQNHKNNKFCMSSGTYLWLSERERERCLLWPSLSRSPLHYHSIHQIFNQQSKYHTTSFCFAQEDSFNQIETQLCLYMKNSTKQWEDQIGLCQKYINYQQRYKPVKHMYYHYCMIITVLLNEDHHCILHQATSRHKYQSTRWLYIYTQAKLPTPSDPYYLSQIRMYLSLKCV